MPNSTDRRDHKRNHWQKGLARDLAALALLLLLCLGFFWRIITPNYLDRGSFRQGDFYDQFYAFAVFEYNQLSQGQLPLWNPHTYSGHPFLADVQSAIFYPLSLLTILLGTFWGFSAFALELEAVAHFFLAGAFTYFFAKRLLRNRAGAMISAVTFAFGGYLTAYPALQLAILETVVWLPLILLLLDLGAAELAGLRQLAILYLLLAGLVLGIAILAGHPQSAMYVFYLSILYFLFKVWTLGRLTSGDLRSSPVGVVAAGLAAFVLAGLGLAAAQILPSWEYMRLSSRPELGYQELSGGFAYLDFVQVLLPHATGFWSPLYVGIFPLLLALFALYLLVRGRVPAETSQQRRQRRAEIAFWAVVAGVALLLSVGDDSFLYSLFYLVVPGFGLFRGQERAALAFSLALSLLAGYGFTAIMASARATGAVEKSHHRYSAIGLLHRPTRPLVGLIVCLGIVGLIALLFYGRFMPGIPIAGPLGAMLSLGVFVALLLGGSLLWLLVWGRQRAKLRSPGKWVVGPKNLLPGVGLALCLIVVDLFTVNSRPNVQGRRIENQVRASGVIRELQAQQGTFRVHDDFRLPGNYGAIHGLEDTWGSSPLRLASYERFVEQVPEERTWQLLNVRYVVTWVDDIAHRSGIPSTLIYEEPARKGEITYVHRLEGQLPRLWIVYQAEVLSSEDEVLDRIAQPGFDPYSVALLTQAPPIALPPQSTLAGQPTGEPQVRLVESSPSRLVAEVDHAINGLLIFSEVYYPGWQVTVDGSQVPILRADGILRAVEVPAGQHRLEMTFDPASVKLGLAISVATLLLSLSYGLWYVISCDQKPVDE